MRCIACDNRHNLCLISWVTDIGRQTIMKGMEDLYERLGKDACDATWDLSIALSHGGEYVKPGCQPTDRRPGEAVSEALRRRFPYRPWDEGIDYDFMGVWFCRDHYPSEV